MRFLLTRHAVLPVATLLLLTRAVCLAQQNPGNNQAGASAQPGAPSADQAANKTAQAPAQSPEEAAMELLARKSIFFPDLATTPGPLTPEEKFKLFISNSLSGEAVLKSVVSAGIGQARDSLPGYGQGGKGYAKRFGSSMARGATSNFFGNFILPSVLHQDPRFFVLRNQNFGGSVKYALRRVVVTRSDAGHRVINWSGLLGPLASETIADTYLPAGDRSAGRTFRRYGIDLVGLTAGNLLRQYWPTIFKKIKASRVNGPAPGEPSSSPASHLDDP